MALERHCGSAINAAEVRQAFRVRATCPWTYIGERRALCTASVQEVSASKDVLEQEAQLLLWDRATRKHAKDCWNGRGNDNLGWNDLQMYFKVIKSRTNRKLVYDFLLVVYSNFSRITHRLWDSMWNSPMTLKYCPRSLTVVSPKSCRVAMYVKCSEESERLKRKSPLPHSHLTPPVQRTAANICINLILPETMFPGLHFCRWQYMGTVNFRTVLSLSRRRQHISCQARNRF